MKNLVVYYSLEGNTKLIARTIAKSINGDILEIKPQKEFATDGFKKYFWCGKSVVLKEKPVLMHVTKDINSYDNIFIGTPIWAGTYASPINTLLSKYNIKNKNIALFACHSGGGASKCFNSIEKIWSNNTFLGEIDFIDPLERQSQEDIDKAEEWAKCIIQNIAR